MSLSLVVCNFFPIGLTRTRCRAAISTSYIAIFSRFHLLNYYVILRIKQDQLQQRQEEDMLGGLSVPSHISFTVPLPCQFVASVIPRKYTGSIITVENPAPACKSFCFSTFVVVVLGIRSAHYSPLVPVWPGLHF